MVFTILWLISALAWVVWFIGYPTYTKVLKKGNYDGCTWSIGLCIGALAVNIFNLFIQICDIDI